MTAIAALSHRGKVYMAGESAVTDEDDAIRHYSSDPKVWRCGIYVMGAAGDAGTDRAMVSLEWDPSVRWFRERCQPALVAACGREGVTDIAAVIGVRGVLYRFDGKALYSLSDKCTALGEAEHFCTGFMLGSRLPPEQRVRAAVAAASQRIDGVGGRIRVVSA